MKVDLMVTGLPVRDVQRLASDAARAGFAHPGSLDRWGAVARTLSNPVGA